MLSQQQLIISINNTSSHCFDNCFFFYHYLSETPFRMRNNIHWLSISLYLLLRTVVVVIVWQLNLQLYVQSVREFESRSWRGVLDTTICDKVCQWLSAGQWFSLFSSTNKSVGHVITEIWLKVELNTTTLTPFSLFLWFFY